MKRAFPRLNSHPYTFEDVETIAKRERIKITICDYNPDILGYYCIRRTPKRMRRFIVLNSILDEVGKTFIGLHELAHHFLHAPVSSRQWFYCRRMAASTTSKHDCEADAFALIAMIPAPLLRVLDRTEPSELHPGIIDLCIRRRELMELKGI